MSRAALKITHARRKARDDSNATGFDSDAAAEVAALARATTEALRVVAEDPSSPAAWARVGPDGQILVVSREHARDMAARGLAMCAGCGQFYAAHGGGLRQHWARGGVDQACAAAAATAKSAYATDEEAASAPARRRRRRRWRAPRRRRRRRGAERARADRVRGAEKRPTSRVCAPVWRRRRPGTWTGWRRRRGTGGIRRRPRTGTGAARCTGPRGGGARRGVRVAG